MKFSKALLLPFSFASAVAMQPVLAGDYDKEQETSENATEEAKEGARSLAEESYDAWAETKETTRETWTDTKQAFAEGLLAGKLETAIILNEHLNPFEIDIEIKERTAVLTGTVDTNIDSELAENIARGVEGIETVDNRLTVSAQGNAESSAMANTSQESDTDRDFPQYVSDVSTTAAIKTELLANDEVEGVSIDVDTYKDRVTLNGEVQTERQKALAERIAKKRDTVNEVVNNLRVARS